MVLIIIKKVIILNKYLKFINIFLKNLVIKLFKYLKNNKYIINQNFIK